ncbi:MAG: helix-turn-helix domain-containing protein, partial [Parvularculaceae bacterium]
MRRRICEAAAKSIAKSGYHRTSIIEVVRRAGISQGALQHHFRTKTDLVVATAEYLLSRSLRWFARAKADL